MLLKANLSHGSSSAREQARFEALFIRAELSPHQAVAA